VSDYDFVDVVELVPVFVIVINVAMEGFEFGSSWESNVESLGSEEGLVFEEIEVVTIGKVTEELGSQTEEGGHDRNGELPPAVGDPIDKIGFGKGLGIVEPFNDSSVFFLIKLHLDGLERLYVKNVLSVVERGLFVIEGGEAHTFEVATVPLLSTHHDPHRTPLCNIDRLNHSGNEVDEGDGSGDVVDNRHKVDLLPGHWHILEEFQDSMRNVFEGSKVDALVVSILARGHVSVVFDDLTDVLRGHVLFLGFGVSEFSLFAILFSV